jgi:ubiquinone/menaquinone biosynthesis C-methylase UbiE
MDAAMDRPPTHSPEGTRTVRARYNRAARFYDLNQAFAERLLFGRLRPRLWEKAPREGAILEVGVGTGANMRHYPSGARVTAIDISERMLERAARRAEQLAAPVDLLLMDAQQLEFADASFDAVVATCVFCSVPDPVAGLRESLRVLKPNGRLLLLEHVRAGNPVLGKLMDWMNPFVVRIAGANINRRTLDNIATAGAVISSMDEYAVGIVKLIEANRPHPDSP